MGLKIWNQHEKEGKRKLKHIRNRRGSIFRQCYTKILLDCIAEHFMWCESNIDVKIQMFPAAGRSLQAALGDPPCVGPSWDQWSGLGSMPRMGCVEWLVKRLISALGPLCLVTKPWYSFPLSERFMLYRDVGKTNIFVFITARPVGISLIRWIAGKGWVVRVAKVRWEYITSLQKSPVRANTDPGCTKLSCRVLGLILSVPKWLTCPLSREQRDGDEDAAGPDPEVPPSVTLQREWENKETRTSDKVSNLLRRTLLE